MKYVIFSLICILFLSCNKDDENNIITSEGMLAWYGDPAVDGCGLVLEVDSIWYIASTRKNSFINFSEQDSSKIEVIARYIIVGDERTSWGCTTTPIKIIDIKRK